MTPSTWTKSLLIIAYLFLLHLGCKETLPTYTPPKVFTKAILSWYSGVLFPDTIATTIVFHHCTDTSGTQIGVALKNIYTETLDGNQYIRVHVEIDGLDPLVPFHRELNQNDLIPQTQHITIDPGQTYILILPWNLRDDNGHLIDTGLDTTYLAQPGLPQSPPIAFRLRATIQLWKEVSPQNTNEFTLQIVFRRDTSGACSDSTYY